MRGFAVECNLQVLECSWYITQKFKDFGAYRRWVNRQIKQGNKPESISLYHHDKSSGCLEIFFPGNVMAEAPFAQMSVMRKTLKHWRSVAKCKPKVVEFYGNGRGGYGKPIHGGWKGWKQ